MKVVKLYQALLVSALMLAALGRGAVVQADGGHVAPATRALLNRIGTWNGKTRTAVLQGPYENPLDADVPFGRNSYYLTPWRAYMDTRPASTFLHCLGVNINVPTHADDEAVAQVLSRAGFRSVRIEIGWGNMSYKHPSRLSRGVAQQALQELKIFRRYGLRPSFTLNANHAGPCAMINVQDKVKAAAPKGSRHVQLVDVRMVKPFYTGLSYLTEYKACEVLFTSVNRTTGVCTLSKPLPKALAAGQAVTVTTLKYQPFAGTVFANGKANPAAQQTFDGWRKYVKAVCTLARKGLGPKHGFNLEVWNEMTFGSDFLFDYNYYDPPRHFKTPFRYTNHGRTRIGIDALLPITVDYVNDPAHHLTDVHVIDGFSNEIPWSNGAAMWPGQTGFSRHAYTAIGRYLKSPHHPVYKNIGPLNALGGVDGTPDHKDWATVVPGSFFVPTLIVALPEYSFYAYQTEFLARETQPFPGPFVPHFRYSNPGTGQYAQVWETEYNCVRLPWADALRQKAKCRRHDPRFLALMHHVAAKCTLRFFVFYSNKGIHTIDVFAANGGDDNCGLINDAFYTALKKNHYHLDKKIEKLAGSQLRVIRRVTDIMRHSKAIAAPRKLTVARLVEHKPRLVFAGNGTPQDPNVYDRDDFACLPFQLSAGRFAIGYYVVTRNVVHVWHKHKGLLDPARYDMPDQTFDLTLNNVAGAGATVSSYDPITNRTSPVRVLAASASTLVVRLKVSDYPRFLMIGEAQPGPMIIDPLVTKLPTGQVRLTFQTNRATSASVSWGHYPLRTDMGREKLPVGRNHQWTIPALPAASGFKIKVSAQGLVDRWPQWNYDTAGVLSWSSPRHKGSSQFSYVPSLPAQHAATTFTSKLPAGLHWIPDGAHAQQLKIVSPTGTVQVRLFQTSRRTSEVLPQTSTIDQTQIYQVQWKGQPAILAILHLNPVAHPGLKWPWKRFLMTMVKGRLLVLEFKGQPITMKREFPTIKAIRQGFVFSRK